MSWSVSANKVPAEDVLKTIAAFTLPTNYGPDFAYPEANAQLKGAKTAAVVLWLAPNAFDQEHGEYDIFLGGHAEPGHVKRPGYAQDSVSIVIRQYFDYEQG